MAQRERLKDRNLRMATEYMDRLGLADNDERRTAVLEAVDAIREVYRREDVVAWWRRGVLSFAYRRLIKPDASGDTGVDVFELDDFQSTVMHYISTLRHFKALPIPELRHARFDQGWIKELQERSEAHGTDSIADTVAEMQNVEERWRNNLREERRVQDTGAEPILWVDDEWAWFDLHRPACDMEAEAMGHCGNGGDLETECTLLSLRKIIDHDKCIYEPHLTFVLHVTASTHGFDAEGDLGEMKGRGNAAPAERYHDAIMALLCTRSPQNKAKYLVRSLAGGEYLPEQDFSLDHLSDDKREALFSHRPDLKPFTRQLDEGADAGVVGQRVLERLHGRELIDVETELNFVERGQAEAWARDYGLLPLAVFEDGAAFLDEHGDEWVAEMAKEVLDGEAGADMSRVELDEAIDTLELPMDRLRHLLAREKEDLDAAEAPAYAAEAYGHTRSSLRESMMGTQTESALKKAIETAYRRERTRTCERAALSSMSDPRYVHVRNMDGNAVSDLRESVVVAMPVREVARVYDEHIAKISQTESSLSDGAVWEIAMPTSQPKSLQPNLVEGDDNPSWDTDLLQREFDQAIEEELRRLENTIPEPTPAMSYGA